MQGLVYFLWKSDRRLLLAVKKKQGINKEWSVETGEGF
jgi:hypothetical protein